MSDYNDSDNPFSARKIELFKTAIQDSRYYLEALYHFRELNMSVPLLNFMNNATDYGQLFNLNMGTYILSRGLYTSIVHENSIYQRKFTQGYNDLDKILITAPPQSHKTWNGLTGFYENQVKKELLDERTVFAEEDVIKAFYISGKATRLYLYEDDHSITLANYFNLESSSNRLLPHAKNPFINRYLNTAPINAKARLIPKVEFIILKEIGFIDPLISKFTKIEVAEKIAGIINEKNYLTADSKRCSVENIQNILSADSFKPDHTNVKSAYKKSNIQKALITLGKMGIVLEQTKYLSTLKLDNPDLFY